MYMIPYTRRSNSSMMDLFDELERSMFGAVSYTHLTLPTIVHV